MLGVLPFDLLSTQLESGGALRELKIIRLVRLLRLLKLTRLAKTSSFFQRYQTRIAISYATLDIMTIILRTAMMAHWIACFWGVLAGMEADDDPARVTWLSQAKADKGCPSPAPAAWPLDDAVDAAEYADDDAAQCEAQLGGPLNECVRVDGTRLEGWAVARVARFACDKGGGGQSSRYGDARRVPLIVLGRRPRRGRATTAPTLMMQRNKDDATISRTLLLTNESHHQTPKPPNH